MFKVVTGPCDYYQNDSRTWDKLCTTGEPVNTYVYQPNPKWVPMRRCGFHAKDLFEGWVIQES